MLDENKPGKYFGEISLLSNLRRTATAYAVKDTVTGWISKDNFTSLMEENKDLKKILVQHMYDYNDNLIKFLRTMVKNVGVFRKLSDETAKAIVFLLRERTAPKGSVILRLG